MPTRSKATVLALRRNIVLGLHMHSDIFPLKTENLLQNICIKKGFILDFPLAKLDKRTENKEHKGPVGQEVN